jgi:hypothetical protein
MKKILCVMTIVSLAVLLMASFAYASLNIEVNVAKPVINPSENQQITAITNEGGYGVLFIIQPAAGGSWDAFLNSNPLIKAIYNSLPSDLKTTLQGKIISYKFITFDASVGGTKNYDFPNDFSGINGVPSTALGGSYKVVFAFISVDGCFWHIEKDFACNSWFVVPESPFGTAMTLATPMLAFAAIAIYKKQKTNQ